MKEFLAINKQKIFYQLRWIAVFSFAIWVFLLIKKWDYAENVDPIKIILEFFFWTVAVPLGVQLLSVVIGLMKWSQINIILDSEPINQLKEMGLIKSYSYQDNNWIDSMPVLAGNIENYPVKCEVENRTARVIADTDLDLVETEHWEKLASLYGRNKIENGLPGIALVYNASSRKSLTAEEFQKEVQSLIGLLKAEKLHQYPNNSYA